MIEERLERIRTWLRYHGDYHLTMDPWGLYGCWCLKLTGPREYERIVFGVTLNHQLDTVERWLKEIDGRWDR